MGIISKISKTLGVTAFGSILGAMLTTNYQAMHANGGSYLPALQAGMEAVEHKLWSCFSSPWFVGPGATLMIVALVLQLRFILKSDSLPEIGGGLDHDGC